MSFNTGTIEDEYTHITEHWSPRVIADVNGQSLKLAKVKDQLIWHSHSEEDELFLIWKGELTIEYRDRPSVHLKSGDFHVVPKGVEHNPVALEECWIMLFEPSETKHTGDVVVEKTKSLDAQRSHLSA
ncbi:cupin domain-containing protein [Agrobacterium sp. ES01]|uniref:cupin domain-containing protein n=1 Tax=Agrobacterium sp. ES01 TaxID=3420714 RepID=UPI003D0D2922